MRTISMMLVAVLALAGCGGGGGGGSSAPDPSDKLMGNFRFQYGLAGEVYTDSYTFDTKSDSLTGEGTPIYTGYDVTYPSYGVAAAWYPSSSQYLAVAETALNGVAWIYSFVIDGNDGHLTGCFYVSVDGDWLSCVELNSSTSYRYDHGVWGRTALIASGGATAYDLFVSEAFMLRTGEAVNGDLAAAIAELKTAFAQSKE